MSLESLAREVKGMGFPRVSGDEPREYMPAAGTGWFSPRERG